jgi:hypothetical protein
MTARMNSIVWIGVALAAIAAACAADNTTAPATPTATVPAVDPAVADWLDKIEKKSGQTISLQAEVKFDTTNGVTTDLQRRWGSLTYIAGPPAGFAAHFDQLQVGKRNEKQDRTYIFDGTWLVERIVDSKAGKDFNKTQIVPPDAPPGAMNPLALGNGPFPLPVNMKKDVVLQRYTVTLVPPQNGAALPEDQRDPVDKSVHLKLVPRPGTRVHFSEADLWYDAGTLLPQKVRTFDEGSGDIKVIDLSKVAVNGKVDPKKVLDTSEPQGADREGWNITVKPWKDEK